MYSRTMPLTDPPAESPIADGVMWIQGAALGTVATVIAVVAVAVIGFMMFSGRLELRRGVTVVLGCFILFGASGIAAALAGLDSPEGRNLRPASPDAGPFSKSLQAPAPSASVYDPYAGASVPSAR